MGKDKDDSVFDFDKDPKFNENFYKNIENALGDSNAVDDKPEESINIEAEVETVDQKEAAPINEKVADSDKGKAADAVQNNTKEESGKKDADPVKAGQKDTGKETDEITFDRKKADGTASGDDVDELEIDDKLTDINLLMTNTG
jgi:hypothetical protein